MRVGGMGDISDLIKSPEAKLTIANSMLIILPYVVGNLSTPLFSWGQLDVRVNSTSKANCVVC